jgi:23S rRNA (adenine2503-C2)-methyltransferase
MKPQQNLPTTVGAGLPDIAEMSVAELEAALEARGTRPFHARQLYRWVYRRGVTDFDAMTDLPSALRLRLGEEFFLSSPAVQKRERSSDGTEKFVFELADRRRIEAVFIPDTPGMTFCISTQVGCAMRCAFCLTGKMGLSRNLTAGEIAGQIRVMARLLNLLDTRFNIVLMGMGEPLHNYEQTMKALRLLADPNGLAVSSRRVTLSTVGVLPALERLATEPYMPNLAVSLHATTDEQRGRLVPVNRKYGLSDLVEACRRFPLKRRSRITFEYVLLAGVNDTLDDARRLVKLLDGVRSKVNLIPLNEAPGIPFERPSEERINSFADYLARHRLTVSVRKSRGRDIRAACGQLILDGSLKSPAQRVAELM